MLWRYEDENSVRLIYWMNGENTNNREIIWLGVISLVIFVVCLAAANLILPEHCELFSTNIESPFACDALSFPPRPCPICQDRRQAIVSQVLLGLAFAFLVMPVIVMYLRDRLKRPSESPTILP